MRLFILEMKKIWMAKRTKIMLGVGLALAIVMSFVPISQEYRVYIDQNGEKVVATGMSAIRYTRQERKQYDGVITSKKLKKALKKYKTTLRREGVTNLDDLSLESYTKNIGPVIGVLQTLPAVYENTQTGISKDLLNISLKDAKNHYKQCKNYFRAKVEKKYPNNIGAQKKAKKLYEKVDTPFESYGSFSEYTVSFIEYYKVILLFLCVAMAAPALAEEYQNGSDSILRCTKYGRGKLIVTKIMAFFVLFVAYAAICLGFQLLLLNLSYGTDCLKTSMQVLFSVTSLAPYRLGELEVVLVFSAIVTILSMTSCALYISSKCNNAAVAILLSIFLCIAPTFLYSAIGDHLPLYLFPASAIGVLNNVLTQLTDIHITNIAWLHIWTPTFMTAVAVIELIVFSILAVKNYCMHEVA